MAGEVSLAEQLGCKLRGKGAYLVTAESCTGGFLAHLITEIPGASDYYLGGIVAYSNKAKERFLGVSPQTLARFGAVSEQTAREMAEGARHAFMGIQPLEKIIAVAITGIAGPSGGTPEKPVGTVWIAAAGMNEILANKYFYKGDRSEIKQKSAKQALKFIVSLGDFSK